MQRLLPPSYHIPVLVVCITQVDVEGITSFEPNATRQALVIAGAKHERRLLPVACTRLLGWKDAGHCLSLGRRPYLLRGRRGRGREEMLA
jgi:hypothetical protein